MSKTIAIPVMVLGKNVKPRLHFPDLVSDFSDLVYETKCLEKAACVCDEKQC